MKSIRSPQFLASLLALVFLAACASTQLRTANPVDFVEPMHKLTFAVKAELDNPFSSAHPSGDQLLSAAMNEKPELQRAFKAVHILITNRNNSAVLLLTSLTNRNVAWLEFATWSPDLRKFHYLSNPPSPAKFTISLP